MNDQTWSRIPVLKDQTETFATARKKAKAKDLQVHPLLDLVSIAWGCQYRAYCVQTIKHGCRPVPLQTDGTKHDSPCTSVIQYHTQIQGFAGWIVFKTGNRTPWKK